MITVNDDATFEHDETMALNLSNAVGAPIGDAQGVGTIANDDDAPGVSVGNASVTEGNTGQRMLTFTVSLTGDTDIDATVDFATAGVTAAQGTDFLGSTGTLTIPAGDTSAAIAVVVNGDAVFESDETLSMTLSDPTERAASSTAPRSARSTTTTRHPPPSPCASRAPRGAWPSPASWSARGAGSA